MEKVKKVIKHAREIFPNASMDFCIGVNNYLSGKYDKRYLHQETSEFRLGYYHGLMEQMDKDYEIGFVR